MAVDTVAGTVVALVVGLGLASQPVTAAVPFAGYVCMGCRGDIGEDIAAAVGFGLPGDVER